jgi:DNA invertase Pin-like site-specific DNA recombinase
MDLTAYLRYSPGGEDQSLEIQREAITAWADAEGHVIVSWHDDAGISGGESLDVRAGLYECLEAVKDGTVAGIVVKCLDRLSRDMLLQESLLATITKDGGLTFSVNPTEMSLLNNDDDSDPYRKAVRQILGILAELERKVIVSRMKAGRRLAASQGKFAFGAPSFEFDRVPHASGKGTVLVPNESRLAVRARMVALRDSGLTIAQVTDALNSEGFTAPRGGKWVTSSVYRALQRAAA